jgi:S-DNA-T family DNA segregation ATPase FtsK/SpoIIIE
MVELVRFNGLPHLYGKVETDLERILGVLRWTVAEMDRRYKLLESSRSRNINTYNRKMRRRRNSEPLPHIVVMIDELADLMMTAPEQTEPALVRLAQMARATGIHLVVATQRPSTDVVTGLIKANFPARISFAVASSIDSRVILDTTGAESLLGRGDMLFMAPDSSKLQRLQGAFVSDRELGRLVRYWKGSHVVDEASSPSPESTSAIAPKSAEEVPAVQQPLWADFKAKAEAAEQEDDLLPQAIEVVRSHNRASISLLQRRLRIGYARAARLIDLMEQQGIIGPDEGGGRSRQVLVDRPDDESAL